ncbi:unnamed protein product, partial [Rotaria sp. Silwood1]
MNDWKSAWNHYQYALDLQLQYQPAEHPFTAFLRDIMNDL